MFRNVKIVSFLLCNVWILRWKVHTVHLLVLTLSSFELSKDCQTMKCVAKCYYEYTYSAYEKSHARLWIDIWYSCERVCSYSERLERRAASTRKFKTLLHIADSRHEAHLRSFLLMSICVFWRASRKRLQPINICSQWEVFVCLFVKFIIHTF